MKKKSKRQAAAEAQVQRFRDDLGPFVVAAEMTRMAMVFTDASDNKHRIIFANDSFLIMAGMRREQVLGESFNTLLAPGVSPYTLSKIDASFNGAGEVEGEVHFRRADGSEFWSSIFISPVIDKSGKTLQHFVSLVDLTRYKQDQARSAMLIDELNHRVKNILSTVQSIAFQALRSSDDPAVIREAIESRLFALSTSHDLLTREKWEGAGLTDLIRESMRPFSAMPGRGERIVMVGENIVVSPKIALGLSIALNELATNAAKYGALANTVGAVRIGWVEHEDVDGPRLVLRWEESGGPTVTRPTRTGFGSRVIERGLVHELDAHVSLEFPPTGVVCIIDIPLRTAGASHG